MFLKNSIIKNGAVIGAKSLINKKIDNYAIAVGMKPSELMERIAEKIDDEMEMRLVAQIDERVRKHKTYSKKQPDIVST